MLPAVIHRLNATPAFSGHETFALRGNWLKKAYDLLQDMPDLFYREDAFVRLGVGKNMAHSIRYWGRVCGVFVGEQREHQCVATRLGTALLADDGWDPFLVSASARWILHWQIAGRPEAAFTFFFAFNLGRVGEFSVASLGEQIQAYVAERDYPAPSDSTLKRDIECLLHCYLRPSSNQLAHTLEDLLACPLTDLGLITMLPGLDMYRLPIGPQPTLVNELVGFAILELLHRNERVTISFTDLASAPGGPGRVFRLDEDSLLNYLYCLEDVTNRGLVYTESAGIRQVSWNKERLDFEGRFSLLEQAFRREMHNG